MIAVKKNSATMSTLPFRVISVLFSVAAVILIFAFYFRQSDVTMELRRFRVVVVELDEKCDRNVVFGCWNCINGFFSERNLESIGCVATLRNISKIFARAIARCSRHRQAQRRRQGPHQLLYFATEGHTTTTVLVHHDEHSGPTSAFSGIAPSEWCPKTIFGSSGGD